MRKKFTFSADKCAFTGDLANGRRAEQAEMGVEAANRHRGEPVRIDEDSVRDLLADLGHLCDREGLDFPALIDTAKKDWRAER